MDFSYFLSGSYTIVLKADDFKRFWGICTYHGISFIKLNLRNCEEENRKECCCQIRCSYYPEIQEIAEKTNVKIEILQRHGLPVLFDKIKLHIWFFTGAVMALFLLISLSNRIWNIEFDGNCYYGNEKLERFLKEEKIIEGIRTAQIDCPNLSARIRSEFPRITWASSEIDGCKLIIHMKENILIENDTDEKIGAYDLVAEKDGIVEKILVRQGIAQVEVGQSVKKGDILISGYIPIENDAMEIIAYEETISEGDVYLKCEYAYYDEIQRKYDVYTIIEEKILPLIQIGNYQLEFLWLTKPDTSEKSEKYLDEWNLGEQLWLTNSLKLPLQIMEKKKIIYEKRAINHTDLELKTLAKKHFDEFSGNLKKKGVQIYENNVKMELSDLSCTLSGKVTVLEKSSALQKATQMNSYDDNMEE